MHGNKRGFLFVWWNRNSEYSGRTLEGQLRNTQTHTAEASSGLTVQSLTVNEWLIVWRRPCSWGVIHKCLWGTQSDRDRRTERDLRLIWYLQTVAAVQLDKNEVEPWGPSSRPHTPVRTQPLLFWLCPRSARASRLRAFTRLLVHTCKRLGSAESPVADLYRPFYATEEEFLQLRTCWAKLCLCLYSEYER